MFEHSWLRQELNIFSIVNWTSLIWGFSLSLQALEEIKLYQKIKSLNIFQPKFLKIILSLKIFLSLSLMAVIFIKTPILQSIIVSILFWVTLMLQYKFRGSFNGGSDRMTIQVGLVLVLSTNAIIWNPIWAHYALLYLAIQTLFSYGIAGLVKIKNSGWRNGQSLHDYLKYSYYSVPRIAKNISHYPLLMKLSSWIVIFFELGLIPAFLLLNGWGFIGLLMISMYFHVCVYAIFGLNRFFFAWIAAYPSLLYLKSILIFGMESF